MLNFLPCIVFVCFFIFLVYEIIPKKHKKRSKSSILFSASITEKGEDADKVFELLRKNNIKPNFLGNSWFYYFKLFISILFAGVKIKAYNIMPWFYIVSFITIISSYKPILLLYYLLWISICVYGTDTPLFSISTNIVLNASLFTCSLFIVLHFTFK